MIYQRQKLLDKSLRSAAFGLVRRKSGFFHFQPVYPHIPTLGELTTGKRISSSHS